MEIEVLTPKLNDTKSGEVFPEGNNSQINPSTQTHNEAVKEKFFETPTGGSTRESITTNTNVKSRITKIPAFNVATQQKRDSLAETTKRSEGEECANRSMASTLLNVERRSQIRSASGITRPRKLKNYSKITI